MDFCNDVYKKHYPTNSKTILCDKMTNLQGTFLQEIFCKNRFL